MMANINVNRPLELNFFVSADVPNTTQNFKSIIGPSKRDGKWNTVLVTEPI